MSEDTKDKVYVFIYAFTADYGYSPTYAQIAKGVGLKAKSHIKYILDEMKEEGRVTFEPGSPRTVRVL